MGKKKPAPVSTNRPAPSGAGGPKPHLTRKVAESLGGGEVRLYDLRSSSLPDVVNTPPEKEAAEWRWWLVHFPSRACAAVKGERPEALRVLKQFERGVDELGVIPRPKLKKTGAKASRTRAGVGGCEEAAARKGKSKGGKDGPPPDGKISFTPVPEGFELDRAMSHVFPAERVTRLWEMALFASDEVTTPSGQVLGSKPNWNARTTALKELTQRLDGRPREKEKKVEQKPALTLSDMRRKMMVSPEYRAAILEMVTDCEREAQRQAGIPQPVKT